MPVIAVTPCRSSADYRQAIARAGGEPRVLELAGDAEALLAGVGGLLLTGGGDVDPALYGEAPHSTFSAAEEGRDRAEIALARAALDRNLPVLAICRGAQVLNVAAGGTLVQDIPSSVEHAVAHQLTGAPSAIAHDVWVSANTRLAAILADRLEDGDTLPVNSRHHQAVKRVAPGFIVAAEAPDGVIEAIERQEGGFCIGVQWHPENFWRTGEFRPLFEAFVSAAGGPSVR